MKWRVDATILNVVEADTAEEACAWVMNDLANKFGAEFLQAAVIRTSPANLFDSPEVEGEYVS